MSAKSGNKVFERALENFLHNSYTNLSLSLKLIRESTVLMLNFLKQNNYIYNLFLPAILVTLLTGCAFSLHEAPVNYTYSGSLESNQAHIGKGVMVSQVVDRRTVETPNIIIHLMNGYGETTTGGYVAEKPISEIVHNGLKQALTKSGYNLSSDDISLTVSIEDFKLDGLTGTFSLKKITSTLSISVLMKNNKGTKLAKNMVLGKANLSGAEIKGSDKEIILKAFKESMDSAISQIVEVVNIEIARLP